MFGAVALFCAMAIGAVVADSPPLRVCGDPDNLPFSNEKLEGFENKIAALVAAELQTTATYFWWPHQRGLVRNTFDAEKCDVVIGIPKGYDLVLWTKPYYRTAYVLAYRKDKGYHITSLDAPELKRLRIGLYSNTPPQEALARRGIIENVTTTYSLFFDLQGDAEERPAKLLRDLVAGVVDVATPWGPLAGYYAKKLNAPIELVPLESEPDVPLSFDISMGVKKGDQVLKAKLEQVIDRRQTDIRTILAEYGVPLMPAHQAAAGGGGAQTAAAASGSKKLNPFTGNPEAIAAGKTLFVQNNCQGCHGGGGGGGMGPSVIDDDWKFGSNDDIIFKLITGEIADATMPKVYGTLDKDEVWKMIAFIRSVYVGDPAKIDW
jgi:mxaJ protein